jgi:hypothetical protein
MERSLEVGEDDKDRQKGERVTARGKRGAVHSMGFLFIASLWVFNVFDCVNEQIIQTICDLVLLTIDFVVHLCSCLVRQKAESTEVTDRLQSETFPLRFVPKESGSLRVAECFINVMRVIWGSQLHAFTLRVIHTAIRSTSCIGQHRVLVWYGSNHLVTGTPAIMNKVLVFLSHFPTNAAIITRIRLRSLCTKHPTIDDVVLLWYDFASLGTPYSVFITLLLRNVSYKLLSDVTSYPRRREPSSTPLWSPQDS